MLVHAHALQGNYASALTKYNQALQYINWSTFRFYFDWSYEEYLQVYKEDYEVLRLNKAAALIQLARYRDALHECQDILAK